MSDYIKREDAKRAIRRYFHDLGTRCMINNVINEVAKVSSDNLVEVVRCKDCKWRDTEPKYNVFLSNGCRWNEAESPDDNDFCSYGERKDEGL